MAETFKPQFETSKGEVLTGTWENSHVFIFPEPDDALNHITIRQEQAGMAMCHTIFRHMIPQFDEIVEAMVTDGYDFTYRHEPPEHTQEIFRTHFVGNVDTFPAEWGQDEVVVLE